MEKVMASIQKKENENGSTLMLFMGGFHVKSKNEFKDFSPINDHADKKVGDININHVKLDTSKSFKIDLSDEKYKYINDVIKKDDYSDFTFYLNFKKDPKSILHENFFNVFIEPKKYLKHHIKIFMKFLRRS